MSKQLSNFKTIIKRIYIWVICEFINILLLYIMQDE